MTNNWYPIIDYSKCAGCMACVSFCPHGVYGKKGSKPFVKNKDACVDLCKCCEKICPQNAITHYSGREGEGGEKSDVGCTCGGSCK